VTDPATGTIAQLGDGFMADHGGFIGGVDVGAEWRPASGAS
jgi:hypothetical protein